MTEREPTPSPDVMVRKKEHRVYFVPESVVGEEWLLKHPLCARPEARLDENGRVYGELGERKGTRGAIRGSIVQKKDVEAVWFDATKAGLVIRRCPR